MVYGTYNELVTGAFVNQLTSLGGTTLQQSLSGGRKRGRCFKDYRLSAEQTSQVTVSN